MSYVEPCIVFGSGGLGKQLIDYIISEFPHRYELLCVVSTEPIDNAGLAARFEVYPTYRDVPQGVQTLNPLCFMGVGYPKVKRAIVKANPGARWANYIHPKAYVASIAKMGVGCTMSPNSSLIGDCTVGDFAFFDTEAAIGHDTITGDYLCMFPKTEICGNCLIGHDVILGEGAAVLPGLELVSGVKVAAGAKVWNDIKEPVTVVGNPAVPKKSKCPYCAGAGVEFYGSQTFPCRACNPDLVPAT